MQKTYRLDPKQLDKQKRNIILLYGISGILSATLMYFSQRARGNESNPWLLVGLMFILLVFFGYRSYKQRVDLWNGYLLEMDENGLTQSQPNYPESRLPFSHITDTEEGKDGLWISTQQGNKVFIIPSLLKPEDYQEIKSEIEQKRTEAPRSVENTIEIDELDGGDTDLRYASTEHPEED